MQARHDRQRSMCLATSAVAGRSCGSSSVPADDTSTIAQLQELKRQILDGGRTVLSEWDHQGLSALGVPDHLYEPLLALQGNIAVIQPVLQCES